MTPVAAVALSGLNAATQRFTGAAERIARGPSNDAPGDVVDVITARHDFEASLLVLRTSDEMTKRLLDIVV